MPNDVEASVIYSVVVRVQMGAIESVAVTVQMRVVDTSAVSMPDQELVHPLRVGAAEGHVGRLVSEDADQIAQDDVDGVMPARPWPDATVLRRAELVPDALAVFYHIFVQLGDVFRRQRSEVPEWKGVCVCTYLNGRECVCARVCTYLNGRVCVHVPEWKGVCVHVPEWKCVCVHVPEWKGVCVHVPAGAEPAAVERDDCKA